MKPVVTWTFSHFPSKCDREIPRPFPLTRHRSLPVQSGAARFQSAARYPRADGRGPILYTNTSGFTRRVRSMSSIVILRSLLILKE